MRDPSEGLTAAGLIQTGASADRIPARFLTLLSALVDRVHAVSPSSSVYVYGSVATGVARSPESDVDVLTIGLDSSDAAIIGRQLSADFADLCRGVEISAVSTADLGGDGDEAYGFEIFLHHYCVHLAGPNMDQATSGFPGNQRAARGFNGDIAQHQARWERDAEGVDPALLGRRVARKTLLAVAALVSVHDGDWTTDRSRAAQRWGEVHPDLAEGLAELLDWSGEHSVAPSDRVTHHLSSTIEVVVSQFRENIGLWSD